MSGQTKGRELKLESVAIKEFIARQLRLTANLRLNRKALDILMELQYVLSKRKHGLISERTLFLYSYLELYKNDVSIHYDSLHLLSEEGVVEPSKVIINGKKMLVNLGIGTSKSTEALRHIGRGYPFYPLWNENQRELGLVDLDRLFNESANRTITGEFNRTSHTAHEIAREILEVNIAYNIKMKMFDSSHVRIEHKFDELGRFNKFKLNGYGALFLDRTTDGFTYRQADSIAELKNISESQMEIRDYTLFEVLVPEVLDITNAELFEHMKRRKSLKVCKDFFTLNPNLLEENAVPDALQWNHIEAMKDGNFGKAMLKEQIELAKEKNLQLKYKQLSAIPSRVEMLETMETNKDNLLFTSVAHSRLEEYDEIAMDDDYQGILRRMMNAKRHTLIMLEFDKKKGLMTEKFMKKFKSEIKKYTRVRGKLLEKMSDDFLVDGDICFIAGGEVQRNVDVMMINTRSKSIRINKRADESAMTVKDRIDFEVLKEEVDYLTDYKMLSRYFFDRVSKTFNY